jgi:hypothetical protein
MAIMTYVNCYFDTLVEPMFQRDEQGREIFFPFGIGSRGRVVPDAATARSLRQRLRHGWMAFFFGWIPFISVFSVVIPNIWAFIAVLLMSMAMVWTFTANVARGLERSQRRMTISNQSASVMATHSLRKMVLMLVLSIGLTASNTATYLMPELQADGPTWLRPVSGFGVLFFGLITLFWLRLVIKKWRQG